MSTSPLAGSRVSFPPLLLSCPQAGTLTSMPPGPVPLCCPVKGRVNSPKGCSLQRFGPALPLSSPQGWLTSVFTIRASPIILLRVGARLDLLSATASWGCGGRGRARSSIHAHDLVGSFPDYLKWQRAEDGRRCITSAPVPPHGRQVAGSSHSYPQASLPTSLLPGHCTAWVKYRAQSWTAATSERWDQLSRASKPLRCGPGSTQALEIH